MTTRGRPPPAAGGGRRKEGAPRPPTPTVVPTPRQWCLGRQDLLISGHRGVGARDQGCVWDERTGPQSTGESVFLSGLKGRCSVCHVTPAPTPLAFTGWHTSDRGESEVTFMLFPLFPLPCPSTPPTTLRLTPTPPRYLFRRQKLPE